MGSLATRVTLAQDLYGMSNSTLIKLALRGRPLQTSHTNMRAPRSGARGVTPSHHAMQTRDRSRSEPRRDPTRPTEIPSMCLSGTLEELPSFYRGPSRSETEGEIRFFEVPRKLLDRSSVAPSRGTPWTREVHVHRVPRARRGVI